MLHGGKTMVVQTALWKCSAVRHKLVTYGATVIVPNVDRSDGEDDGLRLMSSWPRVG